ncbi:MAG TPA: hypothetical protein VHT94_01775 [Streptosporangiaceae bacterium]|nr:hypothetical protein [Streptosporangiaceae bacterium]
MTSPVHPGLSLQEVLSLGGWHLAYARVLIAASDGDYGFALVDGNGDGAELEEELWVWEGGRWQGGSTSGAGALDWLGPLVAGGRVDDAFFAYGRVPGRESVTIEFEHRRYEVPAPLGIWGFIKIAADPGSCGLPALVP